MLAPFSALTLVNLVDDALALEFRTQLETAVSHRMPHRMSKRNRPRPAKSGEHP